MKATIKPDMKAVEDYFNEVFSPRGVFFQKILAFMFASKDRLRFYRKAAVLMSNGTRLKEVLTELRNRAQKKSKSDTVAMIMDDLLRDLNKGVGLGLSLRKYVPLGEALIIETGDRGGNLENAFALACNSIEGTVKMRKAILKAVTYPIILLSLIPVVLTLFSKKMIPSFAAILSPEHWQGSARTLYVLSEFVMSFYFTATIIFVVSGIVIIVVSLPRWSGGLRSRFDLFPPWSIYRLMMGSSWLVSLSSLMKANLPMAEALGQIRKGARSVGNVWLEDRSAKAIYYLNHGQNLGQALESTKMGFPDKEVIEDLIVYSNLPGFDDVLFRMSREWIDDSVEKIEGQSKILFNMCLMAVGMVFVMIATGLYEINTQIVDALQGASSVIR